MPRTETPDSLSVWVVRNGQSNMESSLTLCCYIRHSSYVSASCWGPNYLRRVTSPSEVSRSKRLIRPLCQATVQLMLYVWTQCSRPTRDEDTRPLTGPLADLFSQYPAPALLTLSGNNERSCGLCSACVRALSRAAEYPLLTHSPFQTTHQMHFGSENIL